MRTIIILLVSLLFLSVAGSAIHKQGPTLTGKSDISIEWAGTVIEAQVANQSGVAGNTVYLFGMLY